VETGKPVPIDLRLWLGHLQVLPLIVKFGLVGRPVAVFTEALGSQRHHGHVAMLVNEHSASAAEMVAAFASEYRLATLVGTTTAGQLVATSAFKVGFGYRVVMPVATYFTWHGTNLEGVAWRQRSKSPFHSTPAFRAETINWNAPHRLSAKRKDTRYRAHPPSTRLARDIRRVCVLSHCRLR
jgi:hypothetical protein